MTLVALFVTVFQRNAWVGDDAYITFRSVEQLVAGHGPRWNPHERVQAFTHPLWFGLLALSRLASSHLFRNALLLSLALSLATILLLPRVMATGRPRGGAHWREARWALAGCLLISSRAWVDYAWCGLENPLTYLLLVLFAASVIRGLGPLVRLDQRGDRQAARSSFWAALWAGLLILCRPDNALLCLPALLAVGLRERRQAGWLRTVSAALAGMAPLFVWEVFSLAYYGFLVPNTAYAKLGTGIAASELWAQGLHYLANAFRHDPLTPTILLGGALVGLALRGPTRWLAVGVLLHLIYVLKVGGDFMAGRFLTGGFMVGVLILIRIDWPRWALAAGFGVVLVLQWAVPAMPLWTPADYQPQWDFRDSYGIADEKGFYYDRNSWRLRWRKPLEPYEPRYGVVVWDMIGFFGHGMPHDTIVVDQWGLSDPLLGRLPAASGWRIGHFQREIPSGYVESLQSGENLIENPVVHELYEKIRVVTQGPIFSLRRARAIWELNFFPELPGCAEPPCGSR